MAEGSYMADPAKTYKRFLARSPHQLRFDHGMIGFALEVVSRIKLLESLPITTEVGRQEAIVCLQTMLVEVGFNNEIYRLYDFLNEWRKPRFVASEVDDAGASAPEARSGAPSPPGAEHAPSVGRRSPDARTISEQGVSTASAWRRRHFG